MFWMACARSAIRSSAIYFNKVVGQRLEVYRDGAIFFAFSRKLDANAGRSGKIET